MYASWSPASEWEEDGFPVEDWTTDKFTYHQIGFINDPKHNQLLLYIDMCPASKANMKKKDKYSPSGYEGGYRKLMPSGYDIKIGNVTYSLTLKVEPWNIQNGQSGFDKIEVWDSKTRQDKFQSNVCHYYSDSEGRQSALVTIPYSMFNRDDLNESTNITMQNINLGGNKEIKISGASTGPYIPVIIAFVLASITVVGYYHKRKLVCHEHQ
ncbi:MAG: Firmicu-CTERM sorting domain-containing protein [Lactobacillus sp.]